MSSTARLAHFLAERTSLPIHDQNCLTVLETGRDAQATESAVELKAGSWIGNDALFWLGHPKLPDAREVRISEINVCTRRAHVCEAGEAEPAIEQGGEENEWSKLSRV